MKLLAFGAVAIGSVYFGRKYGVPTRRALQIASDTWDGGKRFDSMKRAGADKPHSAEESGDVGESGLKNGQPFASHSGIDEQKGEPHPQGNSSDQKPIDVTEGAKFTFRSRVRRFLYRLADRV